MKQFDLTRRDTIQLVPPTPFTADGKSVKYDELSRFIESVVKAGISVLLPAAGALGYISKDQATDKIIEAIRRVVTGKVWLSDAMTENLLLNTVGAKRESVSQSPANALSVRELEVSQLIGEGVKTADIAQRLHLSIKTVETYRDRIRLKLNVSSGTELARAATVWVLEQR